MTNDRGSGRVRVRTVAALALAMTTVGLASIGSLSVYRLFAGSASTGEDETMVAWRSNSPGFLQSCRSDRSSSFVPADLEDYLDALEATAGKPRLALTRVGGFAPLTVDIRLIGHDLHVTRQMTRADPVGNACRSDSELFPYRYETVLSRLPEQVAEALLLAVWQGAIQAREGEFGMVDADSLRVQFPYDVCVSFIESGDEVGDALLQLTRVMERLGQGDEAADATDLDAAIAELSGLTASAGNVRRDRDH